MGNLKIDSVPSIKAKKQGEKGGRREGEHFISCGTDKKKRREGREEEQGEEERGV